MAESQQSLHKVWEKCFLDVVACSFSFADHSALEIVLEWLRGITCRQRSPRDTWELGHILTLGWSETDHSEATVRLWSQASSYLKEVSRSGEKKAELAIALSIKELIEFLDLIFYYRRLNWSYGLVSRPLTVPTEEGMFLHGSHEAATVFLDLKKAMI